MRKLDLQDEGDQQKLPPKCKSKGATPATQIPDLNIPVGVSNAIVLAGLVSSRVNDLDATADSDGSSMIERLKKQRRGSKKCKIGSGCDGQPSPGIMNLLSVNCQGCGKPEVIQELRQPVEEKKPAVVYLMKTRMGDECALGLKRNLGYSNVIVVKSEGLSRGLMLLWRQDVVVAELSKSKSHIDAHMSRDSLRISQMRLMGFYGEPRREQHKESWYLMRFLRVLLDYPWLCVGDFNEVLSAEEQIEANEREPW